MGNIEEITLEDALNMLAAAKLQIEEQQQQLKTKDDIILEKDLKIDSQIAIINQKNIELETEKQEKEKLRLDYLRLHLRKQRNINYNLLESKNKEIIL